MFWETIVFRNKYFCADLHSNSRQDEREMFASHNPQLYIPNKGVIGITLLELEMLGYKFMSIS